MGFLSFCIGVFLASIFSFITCYFGIWNQSMLCFTERGIDMDAYMHVNDFSYIYDKIISKFWHFVLFSLACISHFSKSFLLPFFVSYDHLYITQCTVNGYANSALLSQNLLFSTNFGIKVVNHFDPTALHSYKKWGEIFHSWRLRIAMNTAQQWTHQRPLSWLPSALNSST